MTYKFKTLISATFTVKNRWISFPYQYTFCGDWQPWTQQMHYEGKVESFQLTGHPLDKWELQEMQNICEIYPIGEVGERK